MSAPHSAQFANDALFGFGYGGIGFTFDGPQPLLDCVAQLARITSSVTNDSRTGEAALALAPYGREISLARVSCRLNTAAPAKVFADTRQLRWECLAGEWSLRAGATEARVWREGADYAVTATLPTDCRAVSAMMWGLSSAVLHDRGGVMLHAASVVLDDGIIAFVGPSGAGKSTACMHVSEASTFSIDRLALAPRATSGIGGVRWFAHPLPGGTIIDRNARRSAARWLPLRAVFRIHQAATTSVDPCSPVAAISALRESGYHCGLGAGVELELLSRLETLAAAVPVSRLNLSLGTSLTPLLRRWLVQQEQGEARA